MRTSPSGSARVSKHRDLSVLRAARTVRLFNDRGRAGRTSLLGKDQFAVARLAKAILLTEMLDAHFLRAAEQRTAVELALYRGGLRTPCGGTALEKNVARGWWQGRGVHDMTPLTIDVNDNNSHLHVKRFLGLRFRRMYTAPMPG
jgi:hypothetical protein